MTDQHRATPEQISMCVHPGDLATDPRKVAVVINALSDRIEALEAAQLEQAESNRFCVDAIVRRVEALEAAQQDKLDRLIALDQEAAMTELRAASAEVRPAGLVERVMDAIADSAAAYGAADEPACAAIREVAAASADENPFDLLNEAAEHHGWDAAVAWLEQEADRG
jgi:hypothetical protein